MQANSTSAAFTPLDWAVLAGYLLLLVLIGALASRRKAEAGDFFLGGRKMPVWAVAASVLATATTAATFIGGPAEAYGGNLTYLSTNIGTVLGVVVVAFVFIPAFYRANVTTVYDLLERRLGYTGKAAASWAFMVGRVFASGSRLFIAAMPASMILFDDAEPGHMAAAIAAITGLGILTALGGGIRSVIWTDCLQVAVLLLAAGAALFVLLRAIPLTPGEIHGALAAAPGNKLAVIEAGVEVSGGRPRIDFGAPFTLLTAVTGFALLSIAAYGTDHDLTQRMLTCRSALKGGSSVLLAMAINLPVIAAFMLIGLLLYIFYQRPDLMGAAAPGGPAPEGARAFLRFIIDEVPPGLTGLMMAGLFAVGVGSLNSVLAAMSAAFVNDVYRPRKPGMSEAHYGLAGRVAVVLWGGVLGGFAVLCIYWFAATDETVLGFVLGAMTFAYAGLLGVFFTVLLTKRGNGASAVGALVVGFLAVLVLQPAAWKIGASAGAAVEMPEWLTMAFPWRLTLASALAFAVCASGRARVDEEAGGE